jgi:hypothetical protein
MQNGGMRVSFYKLVNADEVSVDEQYWLMSDRRKIYNTPENKKA